MKSWQWRDHEFAPCESVPLSDRGFRYGMSVFESLRVHQSEPQFLDAHLDRLRHACVRRNLPYDPRAMNAVENTLRASGMNGFARMYVTAGDGAITAATSDSRIFLFIESRIRPAATAWEIEVSPEILGSAFAGDKTGNYWVNVAALQWAHSNGKHEALLFNHHAQLVSACTANVFLVHDSRIRTPSTKCGARAGVIREQLMERIAVEECPLSMEDVHTADEIFVTNSWVGVASVASVGPRQMPSRDVFLSFNGAFA